MIANDDRCGGGARRGEMGGEMLRVGGGEVGGQRRLWANGLGWA